MRRLLPSASTSPMSYITGVMSPKRRCRSLSSFCTWSSWSSMRIMACYSAAQGTAAKSPSMCEGRPGAQRFRRRGAGVRRAVPTRQPRCCLIFFCFGQKPPNLPITHRLAAVMRYILSAIGVEGCDPDHTTPGEPRVAQRPRLLISATDVFLCAAAQGTLARSRPSCPAARSSRHMPHPTPPSPNRNSRKRRCTGP